MKSQSVHYLSMKFQVDLMWYNKIGKIILPLLRKWQGTSLQPFSLFWQWGKLICWFNLNIMQIIGICLNFPNSNNFHHRHSDLPFCLCKGSRIFSTLLFRIRKIWNFIDGHFIVCKKIMNIPWSAGVLSRRGACFRVVLPRALCVSVIDD